MKSKWRPPFRAWLIAGSVIWVPLVATWLVIRLLVETLDKSMLLIPAALRPEHLLGVELPGLGIFVSVLVVLGTGALVANLAGHRVIEWWENQLARIPLVKSVYGGFKSLTSAIMSDGSTTFRKVLLIEYPNDGIWTVAFQTGDPSPVVQKELGPTITVYVPTTPNPTSGFVVFVTPDKVRPLDMSVEDALKLVMTLGIANATNELAKNTPESEAGSEKNMEPMPPKD